MRFLPAAHSLSDAGFFVFPLVRGEKDPAVENGFHVASRDPKVIDAWGDRHPQSNIGIRTGPLSGITVVDFDVHKPGFNEAMAKLKADGKEWPRTLVARTGSGGYHYYYRYCDGIDNSTSKLGIGIDTRGDGGYVVAPPSVTVTRDAILGANGKVRRKAQVGGEYRWVTAPDRSLIAPLPQWIIDAFKEARTVPKTSERAIEAMRNGLPSTYRQTDEQGPYFVEYITDAVMSIPLSVDHLTWVYVGMGLHSSFDGSSVGYDIWRNWSAQSPEFNEHGLMKQWKSFGKRSSRLSFAKVFSIARQYGWEPQKRRRHEPARDGRKYVEAW